MPTNRLAKEKSPYLLQHAHNPVDWYPWGAEAFEKACAEDKPIFLSVGYSTCHWCHVMERESFENERIAGLVNRWFVPVKVDREERPDVDRIYMTFVQATTGGGGWPLSVWLTPDLRPFFGGTYFPPDGRYGRAGFAAVLEHLAQAWRERRAGITASAEEILAELARAVRVKPDTGCAFVADPALPEAGYQAFRRTFDARHGGFGGAPKFPRPAVLNFLLRYWSLTRDREALDMALATLRAMARGGIHDHLGGGFHRYAVDGRWHVPHFEKMLYDQAQLVVSYLEAFQISGDAGLAETARGALDYVLRDLTSPEGAFYSAEDADSAPDPARPDDRREGAFYTWSRREIEDLLGPAAGARFCRAFGVKAGGNAGSDPHGEFAGRNILYLADPGTAADTLEDRRVLLDARNRRPRPHRDDKILTAWNGLMISAFALAGAVLGDPRYAAAARRAARFISTRMFDEPRRLLLRRFRGGEAAIPGFLDDYAFAAQALLDLYEAQFDIADLEMALRLTERQRELFEDTAGGGFYCTTEDSGLVLRVKEDYDGAEPSPNSVAALNLLRLAQFTGREDLRRSAERTLAAFAPRLRAAPVAAPQLLAAWQFASRSLRQVVIAGRAEDAGTRALLAAVHARFLPCHVVMLLDPRPARVRLAGWNPALAGMVEKDRRATAYVCRDYTCQLPVNEPEKLTELLQ